MSALAALAAGVGRFRSWIASIVRAHPVLAALALIMADIGRSVAGIRADPSPWLMLIWSVVLLEGLVGFASMAHEIDDKSQARKVWALGFSIALLCHLAVLAIVPRLVS